MPGKRQASHSASARVAFCGMAAALSVVLMLTGGLIPVMTYVSPLLGSVLLLPLLLSFGRKAALTTFLTAALLVLLLGPDREAAFFYAAVGWYPLVKWQLERRVKARGLQLLVKTALFALCVGVLYALLAFVLHLEAVTGDFAEMGAWMTGLFLAGMVGCLLLYDRLITPLSIVYVQRIEPRLKWLR